MIVYLAAAIDHSKRSGDIFQVLAQKVAPATCFNPRGAFINANVPPTDDNFVATMNFTGIRNADVLVAYVEPGVLSFGVPMELMFAVAIGKPVILIYEGELGIYARLFSSAVVKLNDLSLTLVTSIVDGHTQFGGAMAMEAEYKKNWIRSLLKSKGEQI